MKVCQGRNRNEHESNDRVYCRVVWIIRQNIGFLTELQNSFPTELQNSINEKCLKLLIENDKNLFGINSKRRSGK